MTNKVVVSTAGALQAALNSAASPGSNISLISIEISSATPATQITLTSPIVLPSTIGNASQQIIIEGNGVTITPLNTSFSGSLFFRNNVVQDNVTCSFHIKNINFLGNNVNNWTGITLCNARDIVLQNCRFTNLTNAVSLANVSGGNLSDCSAKIISGTSYYTNKCSNISFDRCKLDNTTLPSSSKGFHLLETSYSVMNQCISLGTIGNHIKFDANQVANSFVVNNFTFTGSNDRGIYLILNEGFARINGLYCTDPGTLIYAQPTSGKIAHLYVENIPFLHGNARFETLGGVSLACPTNAPSTAIAWEFNEVYDGNDIFGAGRWVNDLVPYYRYAEFFGNSKKILTNSITVNGNPL